MRARLPEQLRPAPQSDAKTVLIYQRIGPPGFPRKLTNAEELVDMFKGSADKLIVHDGTDAIAQQLECAPMS